MLDKLKYNKKPYVKEYFSASDFGKWDLELYFKMKGIPETNPTDWTGYLRMEAGNAVEDVVIKALKDTGIVEEYYIQEFDGRVVLQREGLEIHGYMDAITQKNDMDVRAGVPIEIKSINNKNHFDISKYEQGKPRENYVGQLAIYMDYMGVDTGYLMVATIDGLSSFWLTCRKVAEGTYQCGETIVNVYDEYKRWSNIKRNHLDKDIMPDVFGYRYKYPLDEIDWRSLSASAISKARNGKAVLGDWQVQYSNWKDYILELQGATPGYSQEELEFIKEKTRGYTTWGK